MKSNCIKQIWKTYKKPVQGLMVLFMAFFSITVFSQGIIIDDESYGSEALTKILMGEGCVEISNTSYSSSQSVAYFQRNGSNFPLEEGVIIRSGIAKYSEGQYTGDNLSSVLNNNSDPYLEGLANAEGQDVNIMDVAYIEFDFIPLSSNFQFNFLFASNEYGEWQCLSSDVFAFLITNLETDETQNLAIVPGTFTHVAVKNIRDNAYNSGCSSQNANYFSTYNIDNPANSSVNMVGYTKVMAASTSIVPGTPYRIKLVIGDANDANFDSAVFLEAGSFDTNFDLGSDRLICEGDEIVLSTGLSISEYTHEWKKDGIVIAGNESSITVSETGTYEVKISKNGMDCEVSDSITVSNLIVDPPVDIDACGSGEGDFVYNLTINNGPALGINGTDYRVRYYSSLENMANDIRIPNNQLSSYQGEPGTTIYIKLYNIRSGKFCDAVYSFELGMYPDITSVMSEPVKVCASLNAPSPYYVDLTVVEAEILEGQTYDEYHFDYYDQDPTIGLELPPLANEDAYPLPHGFGSKYFWVRLVNSQDPNCYITIMFEVVEMPEVEVSEIENVIACSIYELPEIEHGEYYSQPFGQGTHYNAGDIIDEMGTYYIYAKDEATGCYNQSSFKVTFVDEYTIEGVYCGRFIIPSPPAGSFFTAPDGPYGNGVVIPIGTIIESDTTVYYYAEFDGVECRNDPMEIEIHPFPIIDDPIDQVVCDSYTLPTLLGGSYYTGPQGGGDMLFPGDVIMVSQTIYVFEDDGVCSSENSFHITIVPDFEDVIACGSYVLPNLSVGGFYTEPKGQGYQIPDGTVITETQKIYYYAQTTQSPNCTNYRNFEVEIRPIPEVDSLEDQKICEGDTFILPELEYGSYFTEPDREGEELFAGDELGVSQIVYINNILNGCQNETSFKLEVVPLPPVSNFTDIYSCDPYVIPQPQHGKIYTEPMGQGFLVHPGTQIYTNKVFYIYSEMTEAPYCYNETSFSVMVNYVNVGEFQNVSVCDYYVLPNLNSGNYYSEPNGNGEPLFAGDTLFESQKIYVYDKKGDRFSCQDEASYQINISQTPELPLYEDVEICGTYELPVLDVDYKLDYYIGPGGENKIEPEDYTLGPGEYKVYVRGESFDNADCKDETTFNLVVHPKGEMDFPDGIICIDVDTGEVMSYPTLNSGVNPAEYEIEWYRNNELVFTGPDFQPTQPGTYMVFASRIGGEGAHGCDYEPFQFKVREVSEPKAIVHVTPDFADVANIRVEIIKGIGLYVFSLDGGTFQENPNFYDVSSGLHTITIRDVDGECGTITIKVVVIKHPKFFTPNGDGVNDIWNIKDLRNFPDSKIYIFNRYGALLKTIKPNGEGWDGTFHGRNMPSDDYWFKAVYKVDGEPREYKANFTLKR